MVQNTVHRFPLMSCIFQLVLVAMKLGHDLHSGNINFYCTVMNESKSELVISVISILFQS
jgi:hypothetical protein